MMQSYVIKCSLEPKMSDFFPNLKLCSPLAFDYFKSLFFPSECTAQSNNDLKGICRTPEECGQVGGTNDGNCASGFGSCCVI